MLWLPWVVALWASTQPPLALDATNFGARCVVLTVRVVSRGGASPVAWTVWPAHQPGAWRRAWWRLLRHVRPAIPPDWTVVVLADRGVWARWLFRRLVRLGCTCCKRGGRYKKLYPPKRGGTWRAKGLSNFLSAREGI